MALKQKNMDEALAEAVRVQKLWQKADRLEAELQRSASSESPSEVGEDVPEEVYLQVQPRIEYTKR